MSQFASPLVLAQQSAMAATATTPITGQFQATGQFTAQAQAAPPAVSCDTCPIAPASTATYTRQTMVVYSEPEVISQVTDRCRGGVPVSQVERMTVNYVKGPWVLDASSNVHPTFQQFVAPSFQTA